uniref:Uncharacterized protein n=1 Tax=Anguilla anguilla TaxID=7936 RepID=A0A0E9XSA8_ANGAN
MALRYNSAFPVGCLICACSAVVYDHENALLYVALDKSVCQMNVM